jgi:uncharacterized protein with von Willebrand factor type A (vWA) domain
VSAAAREPLFLPRLAGFIRFLRLAGLSVGTGAALDLARALREVSILDRDTVRTVCLITLAKAPDEVSRLRDAFDLYWSTYIEPSDSQTPLAVSAPPNSPPIGVDISEPEAPGMRLMVDGMGAVRVGRYSPDAPSVGHVVGPLENRRVLALRSGVRRFQKATATHPGRRREPARRGVMDFFATARHSLRHGGEWIEFRHERRKTRRGELLVLWDVSGSMREHESMLFALVHALHRTVRRTRVFAFGTRLKEVTDGLRGLSYERAAHTVSGHLHAMGGGTRIGPCLEDFLRRYGRLVHDGTSLVVLSDGWDLGDTARLSNAMRRLHRFSHLVVWVNPHADDPRFEPATAGMREAMPHVDLLLGPGDFERRTGFAPDRLAARRPLLRRASEKGLYRVRAMPS